jgi:hypothetical protein
MNLGANQMRRLSLNAGSEMFGGGSSPENTGVLMGLYRIEDNARRGGGV